jgi:hypothetical protein
MISKKYIKQLEFKTMEEFYNYVLDSKINGNYAQTRKFINKMSGDQFKEFLFYLKAYDQEKELNEEFLYMRCNL